MPLKEYASKNALKYASWALNIFGLVGVGWAVYSFTHELLPIFLVIYGNSLRFLLNHPQLESRVSDKKYRFSTIRIFYLFSLLFKQFLGKSSSPSSKLIWGVPYLVAFFSLALVLIIFGINLEYSIYPLVGVFIGDLSSIIIKF